MAGFGGFRSSNSARLSLRRNACRDCGVLGGLAGVCKLNFFSVSGYSIQSKMVLTNKDFVESLTGDEKTYLWRHVYRYDGVDGVSAQEQLARLVEYVLNFLDGTSDIEQSIYSKALKTFE